jgi:hypothetical protein
MDSLGLVLMQYPNEVITYITDPRTGVQRRCKWPPTIAEIVGACDQHQDYLLKCERLRNWGKSEAPLVIEAPREERPTLDELKARYGKDWGLTSLDAKPKKPQPAPSWKEITAMYQAEPSRLAALVKTDEPVE